MKEESVCLKEKKSMENPQDKSKIYMNTLRIIESCTTIQQVDAAEKCVELYTKAFVNHAEELYHLRFILDQKRQELSLEDDVLIDLINSLK